jgi:hypothetical protein
MCPFKILLVRKEDHTYMRIVYQQVRKIDDCYLNTKNIYISSAACPEWAVRRDDPSIYLRGYVEYKDHEPRIVTYDNPTDELIEQLNNDLKSIYQPTNQIN